MDKHEWTDNGDVFYATAEGIFQRHHDREGFKWEEEVSSGDVGCEVSLGFAAREILRLAEENAALREVRERDELSEIPLSFRFTASQVSSVRAHERARIRRLLLALLADQPLTVGAINAICAE